MQLTPQEVACVVRLALVENQVTSSIIKKLTTIEPTPEQPPVAEKEKEDKP